MDKCKGYILQYISICVTLLWVEACICNAVAKDFIVVIDAGHGGHDPGAIGRISKEKNINLNVALKLGSLIETNCPDIKVIYTRKKDEFIPLNRRAEIANNAKADMFISIHTNALENNHTIKGASTWTLGLAKSQSNLEVAKRENSVILYEDDYKSRYAGFNPNSSESYIIFEFMQDKYMSQSVHLATLVQKQLHNTCKMADRGVHQAGFLVLKASAMPSILVELGFISTPEEERFLNSETGIKSLANGIYNAIVLYKNERDVQPDNNVRIATNSLSDEVKDNGKTVVQLHPQDDNTAKIETKEQGKSDIVFKIQILTSATLLSPNDKRLKGLEDVEYYKEGGVFKYTYGASNNYDNIVRLKSSITKKFKDAFIIAFKNGKRTDLNAAIKESVQKY